MNRPCLLSSSVPKQCRKIGKYHEKSQEFPMLFVYFAAKHCLKILESCKKFHIIAFCQKFPELLGISCIIFILCSWAIVQNPKIAQTIPYFVTTITDTKQVPESLHNESIYSTTGNAALLWTSPFGHTAISYQSYEKSDTHCLT